MNEKRSNWNPNLATRSRRWALVSALALLVCPGLTFGQDWPQWRGPARTGLAESIQLPESWPSELSQRWRIEVGDGQSSPIVRDGRIYLLSRQGNEEVVQALALDSGKELWRQAYPASFRVKSSAARFGEGPKSTPVVGGDTLCALGISGVLSCFESATGRLLWRKDFAGRYPAAAPPFGASMSPLMHDGMLIAHVGGHDGGAVTAFEPRTGEEKWTLEGEGPGYSSPILVEVAGRAQLVTQAHRQLMAVDPATGEFLWKIPFVTPCDQNVVTPVAFGDLLIFSGPVQGTFAVQLSREGETWRPEIAWRNETVASYMASPVLVDGVLYGLSRQRKGQFFAIDPKTGEAVWLTEGKDGYTAALVAAGGSILILKDTAELLVLPAGAERFEPKATYQVAESATWAHPVPTGQGLLVRDTKNLTLWDLSGGDATPRKAATASP